MTSNNLIIVTGHHHSGTTLIGSHIASFKGCSLIWEPLNPTTNNYRFDYNINEWFYNPKFHLCDISKFNDALESAIKHKVIPLKLRDAMKPENVLRFSKQFIQVSVASSFRLRPVIKDPISFLSTDIYLKYNPKIVVILKKPLSYVNSEFWRKNLPPWKSLIPYFENYPFSSNIFDLLHKAYASTLSFEAQQALFWFCSITYFNPSRLTQKINSHNRYYLVRSDEYRESAQSIILNDLYSFLDLKPSSATRKLVANQNLGFFDLLDSLLRNYNFSKYTGNSSLRSSNSFASFRPQSDCIEIIEKYCNPLALQLGWSHSSLEF